MSRPLAVLLFVPAILVAGSAAAREPGSPGTATPRPYGQPSPRFPSPANPSGFPSLPPARSTEEPPQRSLPLIEQQQQRSRRQPEIPRSYQYGPPNPRNRRSQ